MFGIPIRGLWWQTVYFTVVSAPVFYLCLKEFFFSCLHNIAVASEALFLFLCTFAHYIIKTDCHDPYIYSRSVCD